MIWYPAACSYDPQEVTAAGVSTGLMAADGAGIGRPAGVTSPTAVLGPAAVGDPETARAGRSRRSDRW